MATVAVNTGTINHTLPDKFWGFNFSVGFNSGDLSKAQYISLMQEINPEVFRWHDFKRSNGALFSGFNAGKTFIQNVFPSAKVILNPDSGPDNLPSTTSACSATNLAANGTGRSPSDHANLLGQWLDAGINVSLYEFDNEPWGHCTSTGVAWYGGTGANPDGYKCETWVSVHQRNFFSSLSAAITSRGAATKVGGHVVSTSEGYSYSWTQNFIDADAIQGSCGSPYVGPGHNIPYFDTYVFHAYPANPDNTTQGRLNSLLTDQTSPPANGTSLYSKLKNTRSKLDAAGGTAKTICYDEAGFQSVTAQAGLFDALYAVISSRYQATFKIDQYCLHSANTDTASSGIYPIFTTPDHVNFTRTVRSCQLRDISSPFIRNYKSQCVPTITGSGNTPGTYPVPRIQASAGLNAGATKLAVLITNVDLTNSESVTIDLGSTVPSGSAAVTYMLQSTGIGAMPTTTVAPVGNTFTRTIEAGAVYLFEINLPAGDTTPPSPTDLRVANSSIIQLSFDESLDPTSVPATGDFALTVNGGSRSISNVAITGALNALLQLAYADGSIINTDVVNLVYTPGVNKLRDAAHNNVLTFNRRLINQLSPVGLVFGKLTPGDANRGIVANYKRSSGFTLTGTAQAIVLGHYVRGLTTSADTAHIKLTISADDGTGFAPGALLAVTPEYTLAGDAPEAWREVALAAPVTLNPGIYWLGEIYSGNNNVYATDTTAVTAGEQVRLDNYATGPSNPWNASAGGGLTGSDDNQLSIYVRLQNPAPPSGRISGSRVSGPRVSGTRTHGARQ